MRQKKFLKHLRLSLSYLVYQLGLVNKSIYCGVTCYCTITYYMYILTINKQSETYFYLLKLNHLLNVLVKPFFKLENISVQHGSAPCATPAMITRRLNIYYWTFSTARLWLTCCKTSSATSVFRYALTISLLLTVTVSFINEVSQRGGFS